GRGDLSDVSQRMGRLERRDDALHSARLLERFEGLMVGDRDVLHAPQIVQPGMLGTDAGIIETRRNRVRIPDLPVLVLQKIGAAAMQYAWASTGQRGRVRPGLDA